MPRKDTPVGPISAQAQQDLVSEGIENFELPKSLVTKIAKSALPESSKLQKETVLSLVKGSTVFINYLAATAHDVAVSKQHKSISASDVLKALEMIEFGDLVDKLQTELIVYRANAKTDKKKGPPSGASAPGPSTSISIAPSISAPAKPSKAKAKAPKDKDLGAPFTSAPLIHHEQKEREARMDVDWEEELGEAASASVSVSAAGAGAGAGYEGADDLDLDQEQEQEEEGHLGEDGEELEGDEDPEDVEDDAEDVDEGEEGEGEAEEMDDPMEVEEAELRRDARGLEDPDVQSAGVAYNGAGHDGDEH
ncbi:hypothetical protein C0991_001921 [Blastosporella zonata]|nr:hypothetical protein C0991_001921 [Blastosporella zonata]